MGWNGKPQAPRLAAKVTMHLRRAFPDLGGDQRESRTTLVTDATIRVNDTVTVDITPNEVTVTRRKPFEEEVERVRFSAL